MNTVPESRCGKVYLIGAGPGDPGLITVKGVEVLRLADVVVYDLLANPAILRQANPKAELICAGKRGGHHTMEQPQINALLVEKALAGKLVARLKGGDPFVFGRGGEEALELARHGIDFEVVPGVTAGVAAAAYAGIPVTHRGIAASFGMVSGHEDASKPAPEVDWSRVAAGTDTLAIYMGMQNIRGIAEKLIAGGRDAATPAAVVAWGTLPSQRCATGTLATIAESAAEAGLGPPAVIVVGQVVSLRDQLNWFEKLPLFGRRILLTRPREQSVESEAALQRLGAEVLILPTIRIVPIEDLSGIDAAIERLGSYDWTVFTSVNAVRIFMNRMLARDKDARSFGACRIAAIGSATARAIEERFLHADFVPRDYVAESFLASFAQQHRVQGARFLLPRAEAARPLLVSELRRMGGVVDELTVYHTQPESEVEPDTQRRVMNGEADVITFTSASTVRNFVNLVGKERTVQLSRSAMVASIGPATTQAARELGLHVAVEAAEHTVEGLVRACNLAVARVGLAQACNPAVADAGADFRQPGLRRPEESSAHVSEGSGARPDAEGMTGPSAGKIAADEARAEKRAILETLRWYGRTHSVSLPGRTVRVGGRRSSLSLAQLDEMQEYLHALAPGVPLEVFSMDTPGDRNKTTPLSVVADDDFFTRDLDDALRKREIDLAVHSAKDLPEHLPADLLVAAVTPSLLPAECLVTRDGAALADLPPGAVVGISSERRRTGLLALRPDLQVADIRGNVPDRVSQVDSGRYDAVIVAAVGLTRLGMQDRIAQLFTAGEFPHVAGQGQLALVVRRDDAELAAFLKPLDLGNRTGMAWA